MGTEEIKQVAEIVINIFSLGDLGFGIALIDYHIVLIYTVNIIQKVVGIILFQHVKSPIFAVNIHHTGAGVLGFTIGFMQ